MDNFRSSLWMIGMRLVVDGLRMDRGSPKYILNRELLHWALYLGRNVRNVVGSTLNGGGRALIIVSVNPRGHPKDAYQLADGQDVLMF